MKYYCAFFVILFCVGCVSHEEWVHVDGEVVEQSTGVPVPNMTVSLFNIEPYGLLHLYSRHIRVSYMITNKDGEFFLDGLVGNNIAIEIEQGECWLPYKKTINIGKNYDKDYKLKITTDRLSNCPQKYRERKGDAFIFQ